MKFAFSSIKKQNFFWTQINKNIIEAEYAVRGEVHNLGIELREQIQKDAQSSHSTT